MYDEDDTVDQQAQCQANCVAAGHTSGTFANELCSCETAPTTDAQHHPDARYGRTPGTDAGIVRRLPTKGSGPRAEAGNLNTGDGYNNYDIGVIDPDAGSMVLTRRCAARSSASGASTAGSLVPTRPRSADRMPSGSSGGLRRRRAQACTTAF